MSDYAPLFYESSGGDHLGLRELNFFIHTRLRAYAMFLGSFLYLSAPSAGPW